MSGRYDPRAAIKALLDTAERNAPKILSSNVPGLVSESGAALSSLASAPTERPAVEGLCVLVSSLDDGSVTLPDDFGDVPLTRDALKAHVRPDGGVCLGFFGSTYDDAVILYGDPLMSQAQAKRIVLSFWQQTKTGPFASERPRIEVVS